VYACVCACVLQVLELLAAHVIEDLANMINSYLHTDACQSGLVRVVTLEFMPTWSGVSIERLTTQFPLDKRVSETDPSTRLMPFSDFKQMRQMEPMCVEAWDDRLDFSADDMTGPDLHWVKQFDRPYPNGINVEAFQAMADDVGAHHSRHALLRFAHFTADWLSSLWLCVCVCGLHR
jgi:hypothetical protein